MKVKMPREVTTDVQLQQLANRMRILYFRGGIASYTLTVSVIFGRRRNSSDIWQTLRDIERYLKREILRSHDAKGKEDEEFPLVIRANNNTMKSEIKCVYRSNFTKPRSIGSLGWHPVGHCSIGHEPLTALETTKLLSTGRCDWWCPIGITPARCWDFHRIACWSRDSGTSRMCRVTSRQNSLFRYYKYMIHTLILFYL
ncbi:hypothetical protein ALC57_14867 [Trachymyrmex cornetzi]|uniref:Uncharacterized protein n=1 Tax=Trachymyrmex cornetzi TaxID=471704 RepID=A0A151IXI4_9HYME|nr:hypothetical protein ALC57_14867 [Trachymyrmex cornetzi]